MLWTAPNFNDIFPMDNTSVDFRTVPILRNFWCGPNTPVDVLNRNKYPPTAAAAKSLQSCPTLCDPRTGAHQAPPSLGFSRQEHWSGLPFPSPMHESEK